MDQDSISRRNFLNKSSIAGAASAFTIIKPELVRGAGSELITVGLVGCGGRGSQAIVDHLNRNRKHTNPLDGRPV